MIAKHWSDQSLSRVRLFATPWIAACQASLSITNSRSSLRLTSIESVMPSSHLISVVLFSSCPQSLPALESFPMSPLFAWGGQSTGVSALASLIIANNFAINNHRLNGRESEWTPGIGDGQGGLACCNSWGRKEWDMAEQLNWTEAYKSELPVEITGDRKTCEVKSKIKTVRNSPGWKNQFIQQQQ